MISLSKKTMSGKKESIKGDEKENVHRKKERKKKQTEETQKDDKQENS